MSTSDQRAYSRGSHLNGRVSVSQDGDEWGNADVSDVSSGGLKLFTTAEYAVGDVLWFDIVLQSFMSEFEVRTKGEIRRKVPYGSGYNYGIAFKGLTPDKKIQIDENVRNDRPVEGNEYEVD